MVSRLSQTVELEYCFVTSWMIRSYRLEVVVIIRSWTWNCAKQRRDPTKVYRTSFPGMTSDSYTSSKLLPVPM